MARAITAALALELQNARSEQRFPRHRALGDHFDHLAILLRDVVPPQGCRSQGFTNRLDRARCRGTGEAVRSLSAAATSEGFTTGSARPVGPRCDRNGTPARFHLA